MSLSGNVTSAGGTKDDYLEQLFLCRRYVRNQCRPADAENSSTGIESEKGFKDKLRMVATYAASILTHVPPEGIVAVECYSDSVCDR